MLMSKTSATVQGSTHSIGEVIKADRGDALKGPRPRRVWSLNRQMLSPGIRSTDGIHNKLRGVPVRA